MLYMSRPSTPAASFARLSLSAASRATAVSSVFCASAAGTTPAPGFLASARDVRLGRWRLDDLPPATPDDLVVTAERQAADANRILYGFQLHHDGAELASGRVAVVLNTPRVHVR